VKLVNHGPPPRADKGDTVEAARAWAKLPFLNDWHTAIVCGAGDGVQAVELAKYFEAVICFEPNPKTFENLIRRCTNTPNISMMEAALGKENGWAKLSGDGFTANTKGGRGLTVAQRCLDYSTFLAVNLLQIDVAGAELDVLEGAADTIFKHRPVIVVEMGAGPRNPKETRGWLTFHGYVHKPEHDIRSDEVYVYEESKDPV
jgi:FkbM family methyltransferase